MIGGVVDLIGSYGYQFMIENKFLGRKYSLILCFSLSGICCFATLAIDQISQILLVNNFEYCNDPSLATNSDPYATSKTLINIIIVIISFIGRMFIGAAFGIVYQVAAEVYPTPIRSTGLGFCAFVGNFFGLVYPFVIALRIYVDFLPQIIFGSFSFLGLVVSFYIPETRDVGIIHSFEQAQKLYAGQKFTQNEKSDPGQSNQSFE